MDDPVSVLFFELTDLTPAERERIFQERQIPPEVRAEVESLLRFDSANERQITARVSGVAEAALHSVNAGEEGDCGPYRLGRLLGSGGMGAVYLAERVDGEVRQQVAIKLLRSGAERPAWRERFLRERQILASLNHPSIARLMDAGHTADGRPYLAMELVDGVPIDEYCAGKDLREQLSLFLRVCDAVSHAHRRLIIHRDLKPSNILVEASGQPKLLDFGIAKLLDETGDPTQTVERMLTPNYASPEQIRGASQTTATDVYSLGAVLYKLLTGMSPHESEEGTASPIEVITGTRQIPAATRVKPGLPGDIDYILRKALRIEPEERYVSVDAFANDMRALLDNRPVEARSGDAWYRTRKLLRKHWLPAALAAVVVAGLIVSAYLALRIRNERNAALWNEYKATLAAAAAEIDGFRTREAFRLLDRCPLPFRGWEWKYLYAFADTSRAHLSTGMAYDDAMLGFSSDSRLVIAHGKSVQTWNLESNSREASYGPFENILAMASDGSRILASHGKDSGIVEIIEPATGLRRELRGGRARVLAAAMSRDRQRAAAVSADGQLRVWRAVDGKLSGTVRTSEEIVSLPFVRLALSPDGARVALATGMSAELWEVASGRRIATLEQPICIIQSLSFGGPDRLFTACKSVRMWDSRTGKLLKTWTPNVTTTVRAVTATEDGAQIALLGWSGEMYLWDADSDGDFRGLKGTIARQPADLAFSSGGGYVVNINMYGRIMVWDASTAGNRLLRRGWVGGFRKSPDDTRLVAIGEDAVEVLDSRTGRRLAQMSLEATALAVHPRDGRIATATPDNMVSFWRAELSSQRVGAAGPFSGPITNLVFDPSRPRIAAGTDKGSVEIWDLERGNKVSAASVDYRVNDLLYSPDGSRLVAAVGDGMNQPRSGGALRILDGETGQIRAASSHPPNTARAFYSLAFSPGGTGILAGRSSPGRAHYYDLEGRERAMFSEGFPILATTFTPDGSRALIARADGILEVWDPVRWELVAKLHNHHALRLVFSANGSRLYTNDFYGLKVFSTEVLYAAGKPVPAGSK